MREGWKDIRKGHERGRGGAMRRGFTLIELLVSVAIVALVMLLGWTGYNGVKERGKKELRAEAARMGVARWTVTNEQGDAEFRWNSPKAPGNPVDLETGALAYMRATNEFGVLEVRWTPPTPLLGTPTTNMAGEWKAADTNEGCLNYGSKLENLKLGPEGYILKLKDAKTGKEIEVLIPMYTNPTFLLDYGSTTIPLGGGAAGGRPRR
jgi:prepilin-type N-terminal cleavage/methylation domain-containing protein